MAVIVAVPDGILRHFQPFIDRSVKMEEYRMAG